MPDWFLPNYYVIGSLIATVFTWFVSVFLLTIKKKSQASFHLGITMMYMGFFHFAYVLGSGLYYLPTSILRWANILFALLPALHFLFFFLSFPSVVLKPRTRRLLITGSYIVTLALMAIMLQQFSKVGFFYNFSGHNWEGADRGLFRIYSFIIIGYFGSMILTGVARVAFNKEYRLAVFFILLGVMIVTVVPGLFNTWSREGLVSRSLFQTSTVLMNIIGLFLAFVVYINNTRDSTTFMGKIVTVSLATLLLALHVIAFYWLEDKENSYDRIAREETRLIRSGNRPSADFRYWVKSEESKAAFRKTAPLVQNDLDLKMIQVEINNTTLWHKLHKLENTDSLPGLVNSAPRYFAPYRAMLQQILASKPGITTGAELLVTLEENRQIEKLRRGIIAIHGETFLIRAKELLATAHHSIYPFVEAIDLEKVEASTNPKAELLHFIAPFRKSGLRGYRGTTLVNPGGPFPSHYTSFIYFDKKTGEAGEVGFSYTAYRRFILPVALKLFFIILGVFFLTTIGFRFFFLGALVKPLDEVISGLKEVNRGNLEYRVPIHVKDEIGFLARSFNRMARYIMAGQMRLQKYADSLEEKVEERTRELQQTLEEVQALKQRQDGDYFLTTLLLKPLGVNHVESDQFDIEFFVEQKKKFTFRQWSKDIGGDLNIAHRIRLRGRDYIVAVNADAMGKSIQGAGGALVLGSVFLSIIERTKLMESMQEAYPERWIKNVFIELHRIFESFEGSMLISVFLGLVDEESGLLYYINSEHPPAILYRDGSASFFEEDNLFRKLGTQGVRGALQIDTFQMRPGDSIILGSDGRDDLLLGTDDKNNPVMNEDETLILNIMVETGCNLQEIKPALEKHGQITDDLSLLKITRLARQKPVEAYNNDKIQGFLRRVRAIRREQGLAKALATLETGAAEFMGQLDYLKLIARYYYEDEQFENAVDAANVYLEERPDDTEVVYFTSWCLRKLKRHREAVDLAERVRLRQPHFSQNLTHLAELNLKLGNLDRAKKLLTQLFQFDRHNSRGRKIEKAILQYEKKYS